VLLPLGSRDIVCGAIAHLRSNMGARSGDRDGDEELLALQAALTEFGSQLNTECPDEQPVLPWADTRTPPRDSSKFDNPAAGATPSTPSHTVLVPQQSGLINAAESFHSVRASRWTSTLLSWRPRLRRLVAACSSAISGVVSSAQLFLSARRARRWPAALSAWPRRLPQIAAVFAIAIAGWMAIHIGSGLIVGGREQRAEDRAAAVQTPSAAPPTDTPHLPVLKPDARNVEARPRVRAPFVASPASRAVGRPRPLPTPTADPPLPELSFATLEHPPVVPALSEPVPPPPEPGALVQPGIIYQEIPRARIVVDQPVTVSLVVVINKDGRVERAFIGSMPVLPRYEQQLLAAAKTWRYTPALQNGRAIACRKTVRVTVPASRR